MRFNQLKKDPNTVIRKKLYKKGKSWVVASSLALAGGLILFGASGISVQADEANSETQVQSVTGVDDIQQKKTASTDDTQTTETKMPMSSSTSVGEQQNTEEQQTAEEQTSNDETPSNDLNSDEQQPIENTEVTPDDSSADTEAQPTVIKDYNPDAGFVDNTNNYYMSGTDYTIPDEQVPPKITQEGIYQRGMDGTSPYFITNDNNLYFLDGTLDSNYGCNKLWGDENLKNHILRVDTSLARNKVYLPTNSRYIFSRLGHTYSKDDQLIVSVDLSKVDTTHVTDMSSMFQSSSIRELDLTSFNTANVVNMYAMFSSLNNSTMTLPEGVVENNFPPCNLKVSQNFVGSGLTDEDGIFNMFEGANITGLRKFNFPLNPNIISTGQMFVSVVADEIVVPTMDTSLVSDWEEMFSYSLIKYLDISQLDMSGNSGGNEIFKESNIGKITLGPGNKFSGEDTLPITLKDGEKAAAPYQWISIQSNGVVDSPKKALTFYAKPQNGTDGLAKYYDGSGKTGVETFVPDVDIIGKVTLNVPTTVDGKADEDVTYPDLYGKVGVPITLDVPEKKGYQADKKTITATVTDNGITIDDVINYTKIPTGGTGGTSQNVFISDRPQSTTTPQRISIYPDQGNVTLYKQEGQKFVPITNRELAAGSDWYYDKVAHVGSENSDMKYYRVSTNEWVRANQAYLYQPNKVIIRTKAGAPKQLIHAEGTLATSRMISPNTDWYSDLIGYLGEDQYYRVATNEFVNKADVTVIRNA